MIGYAWCIPKEVGFESFSFLCSLLMNVFRFHIASLRGGGSLASHYGIVWVVFMCGARVSLALKTLTFANVLYAISLPVIPKCAPTFCVINFCKFRWIWWIVVGISSIYS